MSDVILVLGAGSSSIKFAVYEVPGSNSLVRLGHGQVEGLGAKPRFVAFDADRRKLAEAEFGASLETASHDDALAHILDWLREQRIGNQRLLAVGHRIVHGGDEFAEPVLVTDAILLRLQALTPLAPLHQPQGIAGIVSMRARVPDVAQVACFDTAFHRAQPAVAQAYALPRSISEAGVRRYGFHGLSYQYIAQVLPEYLGARADGRVIVAHLGNGASMCAMHHRRSVASTMGFTALDGLMMGTRCGSLDPGVILYLIEQKGMTAAEVSDTLYRQSGLLGVSGVSSDMRILSASAEPAAAEAIELFVYRIVRELGSLSAALGGLDAIVFTAGIGENDAGIRRRVCEQSHWLGVSLDAAANAGNQPRISAAASRVSAWVIATDEESVIAQAALECIDPRATERRAGR